MISEKDSVGPLLVNGSSNRNTLGMCLPLALRYRMVRDCCAGVVSAAQRSTIHIGIVTQPDIVFVLYSTRHTCTPKE